MSVKNSDWQWIANLASDYGVEGIVGDLIRKYPQFTEWSGSHNEILHHYGIGGLVKHTREVIQVGVISSIPLNLAGQIDLREYFLAALFHDTGKMFDYERVSANEWKPLEHRRLIHHLPRSLLIWHDAVEKYPNLKDAYHDSVAHAILAHHGRRDAGSPVAPKSRVAWMLHLCDGLSARMNDAERLDIVHRPSNV